MKDQYITLETAKLLILKKFNTKDFTHVVMKHHKNGKIHMFTEYEFEVANLDAWCYEYFTCTQALAQRWLREKYHIIVTIYFHEYDEKYQYIINRSPGNVTDNGKQFDTYEEALEQGLQTALNMI